MNKVSSFVMHLFVSLSLIFAGAVLYTATDYNIEVPTEMIIAAKYEQERCSKSKCRQEPMVSFEAADGVRIDREVDIYTFTKIPEGTVVTLQLDPRDLHPTETESFFFLFLPFLLLLVGITYLLTLLLSLIFDLD